MKKEKNNKTPINVYWSPVPKSIDDRGSTFLYPDPINLLEDLSKRKSAQKQDASIFACPAFRNKTSNTYFFTSPVSSQYTFKTISGNVFVAPADKNKRSMEASTLRPESLSGNPHITLSLYFSLFAEEPLEATFSAPYFHEAKYTKYGSLVPGTFDIGQWFRPYTAEFNMWKEEGIFNLEEGEPLFYVEFLTDRPINIIRFKQTADSLAYAQNCSRSSGDFMRRFPLSKRYEFFNKTRMRDLLLKEIKENII
jgi:hypothetical protein